MPPQTWMVPSQKYDVIHYIRETFLRNDNPMQYAVVDRAYLDTLPRGTTRGPEPSNIEPWSAMDYGPTLTATYEVSDDGSNFAYKGVAVRLDAGPGGVSRGRFWSVFDHDTMRLAASWSGDGFIDWNGINFNGRHEIHPRIVGLVELANPIGPGWADPQSGSFTESRFRGRDGRPYGPLPRSWSHFRGQYRHGDRVVLSYTVGKTAVLEMPGVETRESSPVFTRTFTIGPRDRAMVLQVARRPGRKSRLRKLSPGNDAAALSPFWSPTLPRLRGLLQSDDTSSSRETLMSRSRFQGFRLGPRRLHDRRAIPDSSRRHPFLRDVAWRQMGRPTANPCSSAAAGLSSTSAGSERSRRERRVDDGRWHEARLDVRPRRSHRARLFIDGRRDREAELATPERLAKRVHRVGFTAPDSPEPETLLTRPDR